MPVQSYTLKIDLLKMNITTTVLIIKPKPNTVN